MASSCNAAARWHHDGWDVLDAAASNNTRDEGNNNNDDDVDDNATNEDESDETKKKHAGRPMALYRALNMTELADKLPRTTLAMGDVVGGLTEEAAEDLGLPVGTLVVQVSFFIYYT